MQNANEVCNHILLTLDFHHHLLKIKKSIISWSWKTFRCDSLEQHKSISLLFFFFLFLC